METSSSLGNLDPPSINTYGRKDCCLDGYKDNWTMVNGSWSRSRRKETPPGRRTGRRRIEELNLDKSANNPNQRIGTSQW